MICAAQAFASQADEAAIRDVQTRQAAAWNAHDAVAYAHLFSEDGDVVNVLGWWWQGRSEIQSKLADAFAWVFRDSRLTIAEIHTRFIDPSTAIVHVRWTLDGAKVPPGAPAPPREGIQLQVLRKTGGRWLITSFQNTNSVPETPFPKGPPSAPVGAGR
ncbi:MAG: SgcJ/EcaC family oxidoreductase [Vicinamibacterales bacterium]